MDEATVRKTAEDLVDRISVWGYEGVYVAADARAIIDTALRAAYADGMERAAKAVSDVQPKGAPGLMGELTMTKWETCENILAKIRQAAGEVGK